VKENNELTVEVHGKLCSLFGPTDVNVWGKKNADSRKHILTFSPADSAVWNANLQTAKAEVARACDSPEVILPVESDKIVRHGQKGINFLWRSFFPLVTCALSMTKQDVRDVISANQARADGTTERDVHVPKQLNLLESIVEQMWPMAPPMVDHITSLFNIIKHENSWVRSRYENSSHADFPVLKMKWVIKEHDAANTMIEKAQKGYHWGLCERSWLTSADYGEPILYAPIQRTVEPLQRPAAVNNAGHQQGFSHTSSGSASQASSLTWRLG